MINWQPVKDKQYLLPGFVKYRYRSYTGENIDGVGLVGHFETQNVNNGYIYSTDIAVDVSSYEIKGYLPLLKCDFTEEDVIKIMEALRS